MTDPKIWYARVKKQVVGPMTEKDLVERLMRGEYRPGTEIRREGQKVWRKANQTLGFDVSKSQSPAAIPKKQISPAAMGCAVVLLLSMGSCVVCTMLAPTDSKKKAPTGRDNASMATVQCRNYMSDTLRSPSTAEFPRDALRFNSVGKRQESLRTP